MLVPSLCQSWDICSLNTKGSKVLDNEEVNKVSVTSAAGIGRGVGMGECVPRLKLSE